MEFSGGKGSRISLVPIHGVMILVISTTVEEKPTMMGYIFTKT